MQEVNNKPELVLQHVLETLSVYKGAKLQGDIVSDANVAQASVLRKGAEYKVVVSGLPGGIQCLVSVWECTDSPEVISTILDYSQDLKLEDSVRFPVAFKEYSDANDTSAACNVIYKRLNRQGVMKPGAGPLPHSQPTETPSSTRRIPEDMPRFDDEYEVGASRPSPDRYPGLNLPEKHARLLGNPDLHPMGQADPFHFGEANTQGGMLLDPIGHQQNQSNMQGSRNDQRQRGPGWMPGSKWDDPFGPGGSFQ